MDPELVGVIFDDYGSAYHMVEVSELESIEEFVLSPLCFSRSSLFQCMFWTSRAAKGSDSGRTTNNIEALKCLKKRVDATDCSLTRGVPLGTYGSDRRTNITVHSVGGLGESLVGRAAGNEPNGHTVKDVPDGAVGGKKWGFGCEAEGRHLIRRQYPSDTR